jgi:hypothetical protein
MIVLRTFLNSLEAELAKSALTAAGIESRIRADDCGGVRPHLWMGGIELLIDEADRPRATEVLEASTYVVLPGSTEPSDET